MPPSIFRKKNKGDQFLEILFVIVYYIPKNKFREMVPKIFFVRREGDQFLDFFFSKLFIISRKINSEKWKGVGREGLSARSKCEETIARHSILQAHTKRTIKVVVSSCRRREHPLFANCKVCYSLNLKCVFLI